MIQEDNFLKGNHMEAEKFEALTENAGSKLAAQLGALREKAEHFIAEEMHAMKERGDAIELNADELAMLKAYRAHVARTPAGADYPGFSWRPAYLDQPSIVFPTEPCLIVDPREVSAGKFCEGPHGYDQLIKPRDGYNDNALRPW